MSERTFTIYDCSSKVARYYLIEGNIFDLNGRRAFYIDGTQVYSDATWRAEYYISGQHLFEHGSGRPTFYIDDEQLNHKPPDAVIFDQLSGSSSDQPTPTPTEPHQSQIADRDPQPQLDRRRIWSFLRPG